MPDVTFNGPEGRIEAKFFQQKDPTAPIAVVMHPHPLHGGTMNNKVTYRIFETFVRCGFTVLRFNFRGVGNSESSYDNGVGELSDAAAALDWLHSQNPHAREIWIAGFSFGAWITMQLLMRRPDVKRFIAVSPPASNYDFSFFSPCPTSGLVTVGTADEITPADDIEALLKKTTRQKGVKIHFAKIPGADHFYVQQQDDLGKLLTNYIVQNSGAENTPAAARSAK
ncbi:MAG: alpha/beta hydrolase [Alphaproteobacteria bacterium]|nr:alpha/beta hydrolase [Alphaproteobacteria bacterium]MDD9919179.1 alpha/beta hydrolase [Alphaproteobacteria bacterium]